MNQKNEDPISQNMVQENEEVISKKVFQKIDQYTSDDSEPEKKSGCISKKMCTGIACVLLLLAANSVFVYLIVVHKLS